LQRSADEWLLAWERFDDLREHYRVSGELVEGIPESFNVTRFVFRKSPDSFCLKPRLLERPVVVKTTQPVHVPPGENITFFISSPVCVSIELVKPHIVLQEVPVLRLSDTWFGSSTRIGELCYAAKTHARNSKEEVPLRPHRAVTPVTIHNKSDELLAIEKLSIPVPFLSVYGLADGTLWTDPVSLEHTAGHQLATLKIGRNLPAGATAADRLATPRTPMQKGGLVRAFASMFSD
jgi:hypothetical protein